MAKSQPKPITSLADVPEEVTASIDGGFIKLRDLMGKPLIIHTAVLEDSIFTDKKNRPQKQYRCVAQFPGGDDTEQFFCYTGHAQPMRVLSWLKDNGHLPVSCKFIRDDHNRVLLVSVNDTRVSVDAPSGSGTNEPDQIPF